MSGLIRIQDRTAKVAVLVCLVATAYSYLADRIHISEFSLKSSGICTFTQMTCLRNSTENNVVKPIKVARQGGEYNGFF
jgi:hypothetical protein